MVELGVDKVFLLSRRSRKVSTIHLCVHLWGDRACFASSEPASGQWSGTHLYWSIPLCDSCHWIVVVSEKSFGCIKKTNNSLHTQSMKIYQTNQVNLNRKRDEYTYGTLYKMLTETIIVVSSSLTFESWLGPPLLAIPSACLTVALLVPDPSHNLWFL